MKFWGKDGNLNTNSIQTRFQTLEDTILNLSNEISKLKMSIASINGKYAVGTRETKKANPTAEAILEDLLGGKVITSTEGKTDGVE